MRKLTLSLIGALALVVATAPAVMADEPIVSHDNSTVSRLEGDHTRYGMDVWVDAFDKKIWAGTQVGGDNSYGYYTGIEAGLNGEGTGLLYIAPNAVVAGYANTYAVTGALPAPVYTLPCPPFLVSCDALVDSRDPQTEVESFRQEPILDDMLAKMWDYRADNDRTTQTLDILFLLLPAGDDYPTAEFVTFGKGFIDQTLDQDLAWYTGDISSYVSDMGSGVVNRLVSKMQIDAYTWQSTVNTGYAGIGNSTTVKTTANTGSVDFLDQWVLSYTKDIHDGDPYAAADDGQRIGIVSSYSGWYWKGAEVACPLCEYTYPMGHDAIVKTVPEINGHPNDDVPAPGLLTP